MEIPTGGAQFPVTVTLPAAGVAGVTGTGPVAPGAPPREVIAQVLASDTGSLLLRIGRTTVEARSPLDLPVGAEVRLTVLEATAERVVLSLGKQAAATQGQPAAAQGAAAELAARLAEELPQAPAVALARLLAGRGAVPGEASLAAARFLAGEDSPIGQLRRLAARDVQLRDRLAAVEGDTVAGEGAAVRKAVAGLRAAAAGAPGELAEAQRLLEARPGEGAPSLLFLPLPGGGEARVTIEKGSRGEQLESFRLGVELTLPRLGALSVELLGHQGAAFVTVRSEQPATVARLQAALPELEERVGEVLGMPARAAVLQRAPSRPGVIPEGEANVYA